MSGVQGWMWLGGALAAMLAPLLAFEAGVMAAVGIEQMVGELRAERAERAARKRLQGRIQGRQRGRQRVFDAGGDPGVGSRTEGAKVVTVRHEVA